MYTIYLKAPKDDVNNTILVHDDTSSMKEYRVIDPKLVKEDNAAGSLEFELPLCNNAYEFVSTLTKDVDIFVYKRGFVSQYGSECSDDVYWGGRILDVDKGIENHKIVYCEGAYGFLNDILQPPRKYTTSALRTLTDYIDTILDVYNSKVDTNHKIYSGFINVEYENTDWFTNYDNTLDIIQDIVSCTGGHVRIRRGLRNNTPVWKLDILNDDIYIEGEEDSNGNIMGPDDRWKYFWAPNKDQMIQYGANMLDLSVSFSLSNITTVIYPLGKRKDTSTIEGLDEYHTIAGANISKIPSHLQQYVQVFSNANPPYIQSSYADSVGKIERTVSYDDVTDPTELMLLGILNLTFPNDIACEIEADVIDGSFRNKTLQPIENGDILTIYAPRHGEFPVAKVSKMEIDMSSPGSSTYTIGNISGLTLSESVRTMGKNLANDIKYLNITPYNVPPTPEPNSE